MFKTELDGWVKLVERVVELLRTLHIVQPHSKSIVDVPNPKGRALVSCSYRYMSCFQVTLTVWQLKGCASLLPIIHPFLSVEVLPKSEAVVLQHKAKFSRSFSSNPTVSVDLIFFSTNSKALRIPFSMEMFELFPIVKSILP